jgi:N-acylneuraminate cytidylyltransferase
MICIIPARGGSRRIPKKNIKPFHGKPIIAYSILAAHEWGEFERIVVSTDDKQVAAVAVKYDAEVHWRHPSLDGDEVGTQAVAAECLEAQKVPDDWFACVLYATAPLMALDDLDIGYQGADMSGDYAFAVGTEPLRDAGQFYWGPSYLFTVGRPLINWKASMIPIDESRVCDINTPEDWERAERMYLELYG